MKIKNIVNIIIIFIIIIIFCLFVINKNNIDKFTLPTKKARLFKAPFPPGILGPNVNTKPDSTMQLFNTNGKLSWQQSRDTAKLLGGDLPKLTVLKTQLNIDTPIKNIVATWYPYVDLQDYGWACFNDSRYPNGTEHVTNFGKPQWGITSDYYVFRSNLYVQFPNPTPIPKSIPTKHSFIDGKKYFDYLTNPIYSNKVLDKYYLNDDTIINNQRSVKHPYQVKTGEYYGYVGEQNKFSYWNKQYIILPSLSNPNIQIYPEEMNKFQIWLNIASNAEIANKNASNDRYRNLGIRF